eukprot:3800-Chlamydomonas_euryale.AAC.2
MRRGWRCAARRARTRQSAARQRTWRTLSLRQSWRATRCACCVVSVCVGGFRNDSVPYTLLASQGEVGGGQA